MSDQIKHECGIVVLKLKKPLEFYYKKYGTYFYGLNKLYLLMQKQHNRGQDGAGVGAIKFSSAPGHEFISRVRSNHTTPIKDIFSKIYASLEGQPNDRLKSDQWLNNNFGFHASVFLGHLRYGTFGKNNIDYCHPFIRSNNWKTKNLMLAGNFNLTNVDRLFDILVNIGQHPRKKSDTITVLEKFGHYLDEENQKLFRQYKDQGKSYVEISKLIAENLDIASILKQSAVDFDGGYVMCGLMGHGDGFVLRDPNGIRPAYYFEDDEVLVATSERPAIQTSFNIPHQNIKEVTPGSALIFKMNQSAQLVEILPKKQKTPCSFERIYFSRGSDQDIYNERKTLGKLLAPKVLKAIKNELSQTVFSFIPNTAEVSFYGLTQELNKYLSKRKLERILACRDNTDQDLEQIITEDLRVEKIAIKDVKLRTFITEDSARDDLVTHVYDITYGTLKKGEDTLVVIDDSIVRGTTLKNSILKMLDRLGPKKIIVLSSAPQIRYPDCYGIDMAKIGDFIAFKAAVSLLTEKDPNALNKIYKKCKDQASLPSIKMQNYVKEVYAPFTDEEISKRIAQLLSGDQIKAEVEIVYQSVKDLHVACPNHKGDWYFTGHYPTPGGNKVVNTAFVNFMEGKNTRAY